jgi:hypothetical protein
LRIRNGRSRELIIPFGGAGCLVLSAIIGADIAPVRRPTAAPGSFPQILESRRTTRCASGRPVDNGLSDPDECASDRPGPDVLADTKSRTCRYVGSADSAAVGSVQQHRPRSGRAHGPHDGRRSRRELPTTLRRGAMQER